MLYGNDPGVDYFGDALAYEMRKAGERVLDQRDFEVKPPKHMANDVREIPPAEFGQDTSSIEGLTPEEISERAERNRVAFNSAVWVRCPAYTGNISVECMILSQKLNRSLRGTARGRRLGLD